MQQAPYARKLQLIPLDADFELFRARRYELSWLIHTIPDLLSPLEILAQVTAKTHTPTHTSSLNGKSSGHTVTPKEGLFGTI